VFKCRAGIASHSVRACTRHNVVLVSSSSKRNLPQTRCQLKPSSRQMSSSSGGGERHETRGWGAGDRRMEKRKLKATVAREEAAANPQMHHEVLSQHRQAMLVMEEELAYYEGKAAHRARERAELRQYTHTLESHVKYCDHVKYCEQEAETAAARETGLIHERIGLKRQLSGREQDLAQARVFLHRREGEVITLKEQLVDSMRQLSSALLGASDQQLELDLTRAEPGPRQPDPRVSR
jgi:hypothetical protein